MKAWQEVAGDNLKGLLLANLSLKINDSKR